MGSRKLLNSIYRYLAPLFAVAALGIALHGTAANAQNEGQKVGEASYEPTSVTNPGISPASLKILLRPLSAKDVEAELVAGLELLQLKGTELSLVELDLIDPAKKNEIPENTKMVVKLNEEKAALIERVNQVIISATNKGVDTKSADLYIRSVRGISSSGGASAVLLMVKNWLLSPQGGLKFALSIGSFLLCVIVASVIGRVGAKAVGRALDTAGRTSDLLKSFFVSTIRRIALAVGVVVGLSYLGVNIGPMIAAIGGAGFVIGFALKDSLGNFAAGLMILFYRPFDIGHVIKTAGVSGKVESLSLVSTILNTFDNQEVIIPNGKVWADVITNVTSKNTRRVDLVFGVGYDDDLVKVQSILEAILEKHELILPDPAPVVKVNELADSAIIFIARPWSKTSDYWEVYWDITRQVKEAFDEAGISIPFPQQEVHMIQK